MNHLIPIEQEPGGIPIEPRRFDTGPGWTFRPPPTASKGINVDWIIGGFLLFLAFYPESKPRKPASSSSNDLSGLATVSKTLKGNRLYYLWQEPGHAPKTRPKSDLAKLKKRARRGSGRLYAIYARSADHARSEIKRGKGEIYSVFGGVGCEMFGKCPRSQRQFAFGQDPLVLEREVVPKATDPMEDYLQDMGWKVIDIWELQASIADKVRQERITGKKKRLTPLEKEFEEDLDIYMTHREARDPLEVYLMDLGWNAKQIQELEASIAHKTTRELMTGKRHPLTKKEKQLDADIDVYMQGKTGKQVKWESRPGKRISLKEDEALVMEALVQRGAKGFTFAEMASMTGLDRKRLSKATGALRVLDLMHMTAEHPPIYRSKGQYELKPIPKPTPKPKVEPKRKLTAVDDGLLGLGWKIEDIRKTEASIAKKQKEVRETGGKYKLNVGEIALIQDKEHIKRVIKARKQGKAIPTRGKPVSTRKTKAKVKPKPTAKPQIVRDISGNLLYCSEWQLVDSEFYGHPVPRCARMKQACNGKDCLYAKAPQTQKTEPKRKRVKKKPEPKPKAKAPAEIIDLTDDEAMVLKAIAAKDFEAKSAKTLARDPSLGPTRIDPALKSLLKKKLIKEIAPKTYEAQIGIEEVPAPKAVRLTENEALVRAALRERGAKGFTFAEMSEMTGLTQIELSRTIKTLREEDFIVTTKEQPPIFFLKSAIKKIPPPKKKAPSKKKRHTIAQMMNLTPDESAILRATVGRSLHINEIIRETGLDVSRMRDAMIGLKKSGMIVDTEYEDVYEVGVSRSLIEKMPKRIAAKAPVTYRSGKLKPLPREPKISLTFNETRIMQAMNSEATHIDAIRKKTNLSAAAVDTAIKKLLSNKFIKKSNAGAYYEPLIPFWRMDPFDFEKYAYVWSFGKDPKAWSMTEAAKVFDLPIRGKVLYDPTGADIKGGPVEEQIYIAVLWKAITEGKPVPVDLRKYYDLPDPQKPKPKTAPATIVLTDEEALIMHALAKKANRSQHTDGISRDTGLSMPLIDTAIEKLEKKNMIKEIMLDVFQAKVGIEKIRKPPKHKAKLPPEPEPLKKEPNVPSSEAEREIIRGMWDEAATMMQLRKRTGYAKKPIAVTLRKLEKKGLVKQTGTTRIPQWEAVIKFFEMDYTDFYKYAQGGGPYTAGDRFNLPVNKNGLLVDQVTGYTQKGTNTEDQIYRSILQRAMSKGHRLNRHLIDLYGLRKDIHSLTPSESEQRKRFLEEQKAMTRRPEPIRLPLWKVRLQDAQARRAFLNDKAKDNLVAKIRSGKATNLDEQEYKAMTWDQPLKGPAAFRYLSADDRIQYENLDYTKHMLAVLKAWKANENVSTAVKNDFPELREIFDKWKQA